MVQLRPVDLNAQAASLIYLKEQLQEIEKQSWATEGWLVSLASWQALMDLLPKMKSQRGVAVLETIFSDKDVLAAMGAGRQFKGTKGKVPQEVLGRMADRLGGHVTQNAFLYREVLDAELARIDRIKHFQALATVRHAGPNAACARVRAYGARMGSTGVHTTTRGCRVRRAASAPSS